MLYGRTELMIHKWHDEYLDLKLDDYDLTFDDGLYSQVVGIKKILLIYPNIKIKFFVSTGIIHTGDDPKTYNESDVAHMRFFDLGLTTDFVSYDDLIYLSKISQVTIGFHGHLHIRPSYLKKNLSLVDRLAAWKKDATKMVFGAVKFRELKIINNDDVYYCSPYNEIDGLQVAIIRKIFSSQFNEKLIITDQKRIDINTFDIAPSFLERYNDVLTDAQSAIINAMRIPPRYLGDL